MFDITQFEPTETSFLHLKSPSTEELLFSEDKQAVGITFHNPGSSAYEAAAAKRTDRALMRSKKKQELTANLLRSDTIGFLTAVTVSFDGGLSYPPAGEASGEDLFKALYGDRAYGWVIDQANAHLADWSHFMKGSPTS